MGGTVRPFGWWGGNTLRAAHLNYIDSEHAQLIDPAAGNTYALQKPLVLNGSSLNLTNTTGPYATTLYVGNANGYLQSTTAVNQSLISRSIGNEFHADFTTSGIVYITTSNGGLCGRTLNVSGTDQTVSVYGQYDVIRINASPAATITVNLEAISGGYKQTVLISAIAGIVEVFDLVAATQKFEVVGTDPGWCEFQFNGTTWNLSRFGGANNNVYTLT